jgi:predicted metal-dependent phosphotriesterase family hydrolase
MRSLCHILVKEGITPAEITTMIVDNPTRLLNLEPIAEA